MMLFIEKQAKRPALDLAQDLFVVGMLALCVVGGFII